MTEAGEKKKPVIGIMGEFSAGKSTLTNLLLGKTALPAKVTATRLPPVWMQYGEPSIVRVRTDGTEEDVALDDVNDVEFEGTKYIRFFVDAPVLQKCDLVDFPGISDPNLDSSMWEDMIAGLNAIIWCTHATQSWRQSEAAMWDTIPPHIQQQSMLLITRFDKLRTANDKRRVINRLTQEAGSLFKGVYPIALLRAINSPRDSEEWVESGAPAFWQALREITSVNPAAAATPQPRRHQPGMPMSGSQQSNLAEPQQSAPAVQQAQVAQPTPATNVAQMTPLNPQQAQNISAAPPSPAVDETPAPQGEKAVMPRRISSGDAGKKRERPAARSEAERQNLLKSINEVSN